MAETNQLAMSPAALEQVLRVSHHMAEERTLAPLLTYVVDAAINLAGAERGYLVLLQVDGSIELRVKRNQAGEDVHESDDRISLSILREVVRTEQPLILADATRDPKFSLSTSVNLLKLRSVICVPLIARGETIGALYVENRSRPSRFKESDLPPLILFANQAAVSIENAQLNDTLEAHVETRTAELTQAMAQLEQGWTDAVEANRVQTVLLSNVAHDLRAPLSIVFSALSVLQDGTLGQLNEHQRQWIAKSLDAVNHVLKLTNDLFDLSVIDQGVLTLYKQKVMLKDFLNSVYEIGLGLRWQEGVAFLLDLPPELPRVAIDPVRIRQVLLNLLTNAMKFTRRGSVTLHARYETEQGEVLIGVADTGAGISADRLQQLFQRFRQVADDPQQRRMGTGLGLAISRQLVEMHGGRIWAESKEGSGSDFVFALSVSDK